MTVIRCPFCEFDRSLSRRAPDEDWSAVSAMRQVAVHVSYRHPDEFLELTQTVGVER